MLEVYRGELERAHRFVIERGLVTSPTRPVDVVATPEFLASLVPFAAYEPPPIFLDGQHGRFYVTRPDKSLPPEAYEQQLRGHCRHAIAAMVVHEAYPGHHLQLVTAQEQRSVVRRHIWTPVMVEGWALYCEQLMEEAGFYTTINERIFRLVNLLWRAVRIVLDVGLHTRGMSPAKRWTTWSSTCRSSGPAPRRRSVATARGRPISSVMPSAAARSFDSATPIAMRWARRFHSRNSTTHC